MVKPQTVWNQCDLTQVPKIKLRATKTSSLNLFHQNIRGLQHKIDELISTFISHDLSPHVICIPEHYFTEQKLLLIRPENYCLTSQFSRSVNYRGGACIYCRTDTDYSLIDITQYNVEKVIEACAA
jgi:hypothetical protein